VLNEDLLAAWLLNEDLLAAWLLHPFKMCWLKNARATGEGAYMTTRRPLDRQILRVERKLIRSASGLRHQGGMSIPATNPQFSASNEATHVAKMPLVTLEHAFAMQAMWKLKATASKFPERDPSIRSAVS
jgi:hypothetical protein